MSVEDELRHALRAEADRHDPAEDGWGSIRSRVGSARRRRRRIQGGVLGGVAAAVLAVVVGLAVVDDDPTDVDAGGGPVLASDDVAPGGATTTPPSSAPGGSPTTGTTPPASSTDGIWPFASAADVAGPLADDPRFADPATTADAFAREYVGMLDQAVGEPEPARGDAVDVVLTPRREDGGPMPAGGPSTTVTLVPLETPDGSTVWTVTGAVSPSIVVTTPTTGSQITSPVAVRGRATGYEGTVVAEVRADGMLAGESLGSEVGIAGSMGELGPLDLDVAFAATTRASGAVVVTTDTGRDVGVWEATVVRVAFGAATSGTAAPPSGSDGCVVEPPAGEPAAGEMDVTVFFVCAAAAGADPEADVTYVPVTRRVTRTAGVLGATVAAFLGGTSVEEEQGGGVSAFTYDPATTATVTLADGRAVVDFSPELPDDATTSSTSTGSLLFQGALDRTVLQFATVDEVEYRLGGSCEAFWEWQQVGGCRIVARADL